jgi:hypothetical protein
VKVRDIKLMEEGREWERRRNERQEGVLTVLKYSIDFTIFPFSSGINNIPKASLALSSALFRIHYSTFIKEWSMENRHTVQEQKYVMQLQYGFSVSSIPPG